MKKRVILEIVCAIIIFIVGYFVGDSAAINRVNKSLNSTDSNQTSSTKADDNSNTNDSKQKKSDAKVYKFGNEGTSDGWTIKILDVKEATTIPSGDGSDNKTTQQKFIIIKLQMTNVSQAAAQYDDSEFILANNKDQKQYQIDSDASLTANQVETIYKKNSNFFLSIDNVNPNMPKQTYMIFEVPKNFNLQNGVLAHTGNNQISWFYLK
ncbi:MAG: DUF4352 domain-containing protein [Bacillota bacterium]|nr:DUF4352 domain-containing protein [Bacillota bacterium]